MQLSMQFEVSPKSLRNDEKYLSEVASLVRTAHLSSRSDQYQGISEFIRRPSIKKVPSFALPFASRKHHCSKGTFAEANVEDSGSYGPQSDFGLYSPMPQSRANWHELLSEAEFFFLLLRKLYHHLLLQIDEEMMLSNPQVLDILTRQCLWV